jgi:hypothetical protein
MTKMNGAQRQHNGDQDRGPSYNDDGPLACGGC